MMDFDPTTAKPVQGEGRFDPSTAKQVPSDADWIDDIIGGGEVALTMGTNAVGSMISGIMGTGSALNPFGNEGDGGRMVDQTMDSLPIYSPQTQQGKEQMKAISEWFSFLSDAEESVGESGVALGEMMGSPKTGAFVGAGSKAVFNAIPEMFGLGVPLRVARASKVTRNTGSPLQGAYSVLDPNLIRGDVVGGVSNKQSATKQATARRILEGSKDPDLVKFAVNGKGKLVSDKNAQAVISQGFDPAVIQPLKGADPQTKKAALRQVKIRKELAKNKNYPQIPHNVAGESIKHQVNFLETKRKEAGVEIDSASSSLQGKPVDISGELSAFSDYLASNGVAVKISDNGKVSLDFTNSEIARGDYVVLRDVAQKIRNITKDGVDGFVAHKIKKLIDNNVSYGKTSSGLSNGTANALKGIRANIDGKLDGISEAYDKANTKYRDTVQVLNEWGNLRGKNNPIDMKGVERLYGGLLNRMDSNAVSAQRIINAADDLSATAKKYGFKGGANPTILINFANEMDGVLKPSTRNSLEGRVDAVAENAIASQTIFGAVGEGGRQLYRMARGKNESNALIALERLLSQRD